MKCAIRVALVLFAALTFNAGAAQAWHVAGYVRCDANGNGVVDDGDLPLSNILVTVTGTSLTFSGTATTDASGAFNVGLADFEASYSLTIAVPAGASVASTPYPVAFVSTDFPTPGVDLDRVIVLVSSAACTQQACWLTGGGAKFSSIAGILVAERGPQDSFGGNVNPGCNPDSGEGGNWNHVAHAQKKHFQGQSIQVDRCGNVPGIPAGSESPVTPFNFIEFSGTGVMKGIAGNKTDYGPVTFRARAEDRNEPGSSGAKDGALIDRYFLEVKDSGGAVVLRIAGDPTVDAPVPITDGNLQIHISSCSVPQ